MSDTLMDPKEFPGLSIFQYAIKLQKDLIHLGKQKSKEHNYIFISGYRFDTRITDLLLFVDIDDREWIKHAPFIKKIAERKMDKENYVNFASYGKCKVTAVADFDKDGDDDYAIAILTAKGRAATKDKVIKALNGSELFEGNDVHVKLAKEYRELIKESRLVEMAEKDARKKRKKKNPKNENVESEDEGIESENEDVGVDDA